MLPPPHLQSLPYCNTIGRPLRNTRPPPNDPPFLSHTPYNIGDVNIVWKPRGGVNGGGSGVNEPGINLQMFFYGDHLPYRGGGVNGGGSGHPNPNWPLQDIVSVNIVWCMASTGRVGGRSYIAQRLRIRIAVVWVMQMGGSNKGNKNKWKNILYRPKP